MDTAPLPSNTECAVDCRRLIVGRCCKIAHKRTRAKISRLVPMLVNDDAIEFFEIEDISMFRLHALQEAKRVERANGDQFEAHHVCFAQGQLFEHVVSDGRIGDVDDERHAQPSL